MRSGAAFMGFSEAPINFPPTFKYDVLRSSRSHKRSRRRSGKYIRHLDLSEVDEKINECRDRDHDHTDADEDDENAEIGIDVSDVASVTSTTVTSVHSKRTTTTTDIDDDDETDEFDYFDRSPRQFMKTKGKAFVQDVATKAKNKWLSLISPSSPSFRRSVSPLDKPEQRPALKEMSQSAVELGHDYHALPLPSPMDPPTSAASERRPKSLSMKRSESSTKGARSRKSEADDDEDKGVYDSSSKQRVPSWYV